MLNKDNIIIGGCKLKVSVVLIQYPRLAFSVLLRSKKKIRLEASLIISEEIKSSKKQSKKYNQLKALDLIADRT